MDQESFWQGDDLSCWRRGRLGFQYFPTLTISLAASSNETVKLIVSPRQYLRLVSDRERYSALVDIDIEYDCYRVSISASDSGVCFTCIIFLVCLHVRRKFCPYWNRLYRTVRLSMLETCDQ